MSTGIYQIKNKINSKVYIGSSKDIENRWKQHISLLKCGKHHSKHLQYAWEKYSQDKFTFEIIEENIPQCNLLEREQYWMDKIQSYDPNFGYNISIVAGSYMINDNYDFEEIVNEQIELEKKYHVVYMIINKQNGEIVYKNNENLNKSACLFNKFLCEILNYMHLINFESWYQIELYNEKEHINVQNLYNIPYDMATNLILT